METMEVTTGFALCDSSALRAIAKRRIGSLPLAIALNCCDVGEAKLADGRRVLVTWGRNLTREEQFWFAHQTSFTPVWLGADGGQCELVIGETFGSSDPEEWLWLGIRIERAGDVNWIPVMEGGE